MFYKNRKVIGVCILALVIVVATSSKSVAQSNIQVVTSKHKTSVIISHFPKNATVLITDENLNLISVASTNAEGVAMVHLNKKLKNTIIARTIHGDYEASTKVKSAPKDDTQIAASEAKNTIKT